MPFFETDSIKHVALHRVGNKQTEEGFVLSEKQLDLSDGMKDLLLKYFISPFKVAEYYHLFSEEGLENNDVFCIARELFADGGDSFMEDSKSFARHLYNSTLHPNIKAGDFFVVYFKDCQLEGEVMDAIGLFKSENKDDFLKVTRSGETWSSQDNDSSASGDFLLEMEKGININKLDKGAIIFNKEEDLGYVVSVVDSTNRGADAIYWKDTFLKICQREDDYFNTQELMKVCKNFVAEELPTQFEVTKADQAEFLNKSVQFFKDNDSFSIDSFSRQVFNQPEVIDSFNSFKDTYQQESNVNLPTEFSISDEAVKKQARAFKSVIKLDNNFHIYVHGDSQLIEQGEDNKGKFYKVYFSKES